MFLETGKIQYNYEKIIGLMSFLSTDRMLIDFMFRFTLKFAIKPHNCSAEEQSQYPYKT